MRFTKNLTIIGWGDVPTDPVSSYSNERVRGMIEANIVNWLARTDKNPEELALLEKRQRDLTDIRSLSADGWEETTGIRSRQFYDDSLGSNELAVIAAKRAITVAQRNDGNFNKEKIGLIVSGGASFADAYPGCDCILQERLGIPDAGSLFLSGACCSGTEALIVASSLLQHTHGMYALVAVGEKIGTWCNDLMDKNGLLWGDGGGAVVIEATVGGNRNYGLQGFDMKSFGHLSYTTRSCGLGAHPDHRQYRTPNASMEGKGKELQRWVIGDIASELEQYLKACEVSVNARTFLIPHNGNVKMVTALGAKVGIPPEQILHRIADRGNQSSASVLSTVSHFADQEFFTKDDLLIFATFGGGAKRNFLLYRWP